MSVGSGWAQEIKECVLHSKALDRLLITSMRFPVVGARARMTLMIRDVLRKPDRKVLRGPLLSALCDEGLLKPGNTMLWIGCAPYTPIFYKMLESDGAECFTIDINPPARYWGRRGRHTEGSMLNLDRLYPDCSFDLILCNGVLGWGVDTIEDKRRGFEMMAKVLRPGGALVVGWNTDTMADPVEAGLHAPHFSHSAIGDFPSRCAVDNVTHVYDCFRRTG